MINTPPATLEILRQRIRDEFENLRENLDMIRRAVRSTERRVTQCIERGGRHVDGNV